MAPSPLPLQLLLLRWGGTKTQIAKIPLGSLLVLATTLPYKQGKYPTPGPGSVCDSPHCQTTLYMGAESTTSTAQGALRGSPHLLDAKEKCAM